MLQVDPKLNEILRATASGDQRESAKAMQMFAKAVELPLRKGIMSCDILGNIFEAIQMAPGACVRFPLDFLKPGTEKEFTAYTMPNCGFIPHCCVEGDYVEVPTYKIGNCIDWCLDYANDARWDVVSRALEVLRAGHTKKMNDDGWHTLLAAGYDRNVMVVDSAAAQGQFTKRLVSMMKVVMRRNGGGNSTCLNRGKLTDLYISPEAMEDIRNWNVDQVDEITRREIFLGDDCDNGLTRIFCVNLHVLDELGFGQEYQLFYENQLAGGAGAGMPPNKIEIVVGLDLTNRDSFVMPVREELKVFEDPTLHRQMRAGFYSWQRLGFAVLDSRRVLLGAI